MYSCRNLKFTHSSYARPRIKKPSTSFNQHKIISTGELLLTNHEIKLNLKVISRHFVCVTLSYTVDLSHK